MSSSNYNKEKPAPVRGKKFFPCLKKDDFVYELKPFTMPSHSHYQWTKRVACAERAAKYYVDNIDPYIEKFAKGNGADFVVLLK